MFEVSGHTLMYKSGILKGFSRRSVIGQNYPAITPDKEAFVDGIIYWNIPDSAWDSLDRFEGEMYERHHVTVELNNQTMLPVETYVVRPDYKHYLDKSDWDFEDFIKNHKTDFQK